MTSCSQKGTDSTSPAAPCPHCMHSQHALAVPKLILPHGTNGAGPHPGVQLCQDQYLTSCMHKQHVQDVADFFITTKREHAGTYRCQYRALQTSETSEKSDPVELVLTDHTFPPPEISLSPGGQVRTGTNITIRCWNKDLGATFLLHKDGCSAPVQHQNPDGGGTATFTLLGVTPADAGTYRCSYHIKGYFPLMSSPLGNSVSLEVTPTPAHPGAEVESHENLVVAVAGGCAVALMFILVLIIFFLLAARRHRMGRGAPPRRPEAMHLQQTPRTHVCSPWHICIAPTQTSTHPTKLLGQDSHFWRVFLSHFWRRIPFLKGFLGEDSSFCKASPFLHSWRV
ncbi:leukocyte immunoglobulin-like receptor subfamily B member 2 isoform X3 [Numida meleagris]|uniref:leukocyte immunoglobulin-like receptor subfamily B member 2 isoform X3 n=1 Tax=Numida meleagris TaxID=8996 RepID=UPI000B3DA77A|nr:leukocyte immunoglobulin-like receptor subfamily B member 2 isoform X3 [Numida meleagris]